MTRATLSRSQADPVLFLITKPVGEPGYVALICEQDETHRRVMASPWHACSPAKSSTVRVREFLTVTTPQRSWLLPGP